MSKSSELSNPRLDHILHTLIERRKMWLIPGCAALLLSWIYVNFVRSESYTARQTLIVRDDLLGQSLKPGQFESLDLMKSAQETILEIARKPQVVRKAMRTIGPARVGFFGVSDSWPNDKTIETVQGSIELSAPNGAEFGHTETVHLIAKSDSRERAGKFVMALLDEINIKINEVRDLRLRSMTDELTLIRDSAQSSLAASAEQLSAMEREIGADLPTLRSLSDPQSGEGAMSQTLTQIRLERRQFENRLHSAENQRKTLVAATHDPNAILATSDELFSFQPALSRLKQELIEAQSALAESVGRYEQAHPQVQKQQEQVRSMHRQIHQELDSAKRGLKGQIATLTQKVNKSLAQEAKIEARFNRISSKRVDYLRLDEEVKKKTEVFNEAQGHLASVQRLGSEEFSVTLLTPVDDPQVSTRADGLGAKAIILGSGLAGILAGFGLVLLLDPGLEAKSDRKESQANDSQLPTGLGNPSAETPVAETSGFKVAAVETQRSPVAASDPANVAQQTTPAPTNTPASIAPTQKTGSTTSANGDTPPSAARSNVQPAPAAKVAPVTPPSSTPTKAPVPAKIAPAVVQNRSQEIQAEINKVVAHSSGIASPPAVEVKPMTPPPQAPAMPTAAKVNGGGAGATNAAPSSSGIAGIPTAASILAAMEKVGSPPSSPAKPASQPQQAKTTPQVPVPPVQGQPTAPAPAPTAPSQVSEPAVPNPQPVQVKPSGTAQASNELELRRRTGLPASAPVRQPTDSTATPVVSLEPNAAQNPAPARDPNPFLNPSQTSNEGPTETAQRLLQEAQSAAEREGMIAPRAPVKSDGESPSVAREPASTVAIPDQIKQLTDSIASFAKPIKRLHDSGETSDF